MLRLILSGLVNWVCLDLEKNMKNEVLGWRFDDFSRLVFSCGFGFDDFFHVLEVSVVDRDFV